MMNFLKALKYVSLVLLVTLAACERATPENYFDRAVLNTNMFSQFGGREILGLLSQNPQKYNPDNKTMEKSTYVEAFQFRVSPTKDAYEKMKKLKPTEDTKEMLEASEALFSFVVDKHQNDYLQIAKMKDEGASPEALQQAAEEFDQKYYNEFEKRYNHLIDLGRAYAKKHNIPLKEY